MNGLKRPRIRFSATIYIVENNFLCQDGGIALVGKSQLFVLRSVMILAGVAMAGVGLFKVFWLMMGSMALDSGPVPRIYLVNLVEAPAYLCAAFAWKQPWIALSIAGLTLTAIFTKLIPWTVSPFQNYLSFEYAFVIAATVSFVAKWMIGHRPTFQES